MEFLLKVGTLSNLENIGQFVWTTEVPENTIIGKRI